ncbi:MAG: hypothetical protein JW768_02340 [Chitinispirillaceae bacterium]|nr:hypothetical protein [Chitinispirillaceae bacterium]
MAQVALNTESKRALHYGVHYVFLPSMPVDKKHAIAFQGQLLENQVEFSACKIEAESIVLTNSPENRSLQVRVYRPGPNVTGLLMLQPYPEAPLSNFIKNCEAVATAFKETWLSKEGDQVQFLKKDVTLRHLYETEEEHSFGYIWEKKLKQKPESLKLLKRPVAGGGLALVMPPHIVPDVDKEPVQIMLKVESYHQDPKHLFVEVEFIWPQPGAKPKTVFEVESLVRAAEKYNDGELQDFLKDL